MSEKLTEVLRETADSVFVDAEFVAHLEQIAATEDDLPAAGAR